MRKDKGTFQRRILEDAKNILVVNLRYIGDTIWMYPFIKNLKLNLPEAKISAMVNAGTEPFLKLMPELNEVISLNRKEMKSKLGYLKFMKFLMEVRRKNFDTVIILSECDRPAIIAYVSGAKTRIGLESDSWWRGSLLTHESLWDHKRNPHMIEHHLQILTDAGLKVHDRDLKINVPDNIVRKTAERFRIPESENRKAVLIHPGARTIFRQWGAGNFAKIINSLSAQYRIFLAGGPGESAIIQETLGQLERKPDIASTELSQLEFAALCRLSNLFIGNDSAPIHIAAATGLFVIGIYGPTFSKFCGPWTDRKALFDMSTLPCRPCRQDECVADPFRACLEDIKPDDIIEKAQEILGAL